MRFFGASAVAGFLLVICVVSTLDATVIWRSRPTVPGEMRFFMLAGTRSRCSVCVDVVAGLLRMS